MIQGNDTLIRATLTDGTNPYVISTLNDYQFYLYYLLLGVKTVIATFKKSNTGIYKVTVNNGPLGIVDIVLNRELTTALAPCTIYLESRIQIKANTEFISSLQNLGNVGTLVGDLSSSANPLQT